MSSGPFPQEGEVYLLSKYQLPLPTAHCGCVQREEYTRSKLPEHTVPHKTCSAGAQTLSSTLPNPTMTYLIAPSELSLKDRVRLRLVKWYKCASRRLHPELPLSQAVSLVRSLVFGWVS